MRCEARPKTLCELLELENDGSHAALAGIANGATRKWREPGSKDDASVQQIVVRDDPLVQASHSFVQKRQDQPVSKVIVGTRGLAVVAVLDRLTLRIVE